MLLRTRWPHFLIKNRLQAHLQGARQTVPAGWPGWDLRRAQVRAPPRPQPQGRAVRVPHRLRPDAWQLGQGERVGDDRDQRWRKNLPERTISWPLRQREAAAVFLRPPSHLLRPGSAAHSVFPFMEVIFLAFWQTCRGSGINTLVKTPAPSSPKYASSPPTGGEEAGNGGGFRHDGPEDREEQEEMQALSGWLQLSVLFSAHFETKFFSPF